MTFLPGTSKRRIFSGRTSRGSSLKKGLARRLTRDEIDTILDSYVAEAAKLLYGNS